MNNGKIKKMLSIVYFMILCFSFTQKYLHVDYGNFTKSFYFYNFFVVLITFVGAIFYLKTEIYSEKHRNNKFALLTLMTYLIFAVYVYSHFVFSDSLYGESIVGIGLVHFRLGVYVYYASCAILFINTFFVEIPYEKKKASSRKMIRNAIDVSDQYLLCYYEDGLGDEFVSLSENFSILIIKKGSKKIEYSISAENSIRNKILEDKILSIEVTCIPGELPRFLREEEKISVLAFLFKNMGAFIASDKLLKRIDDYGSRKVENAYKIKIDYLGDKNERLNVIFLAKDDPIELLKNINCKKSVL